MIFITLPLETFFCIDFEIDFFKYFKYLFVCVLTIIFRDVYYNIKYKIIKTYGTKY